MLESFNQITIGNIYNIEILENFWRMIDAFDKTNLVEKLSFNNL